MASIVGRAFRVVNADPQRWSLAELRTALKTEDRDRRVQALVRIRKQINDTGLKSGYFSLARRHLDDPDSTCRWQATIVIGEFIPTAFDRVWPLARQLAKSPDKDVRAAASTVLLEHLLEHHPVRAIRAFESELATGNGLFRSSIAGCSNFAGGRWRRLVQRLLDRAKMA